jgi:hypothetical protein
MDIYLDLVNGNDSNDGLSWATAYKSFGQAIGVASAGDRIKLKETPSYSIGNASWTNLSKTITLANAQTKDICDCDTVWVKDGASAVSRSTAQPTKQGSAHVSITIPGTSNLNSLMAHFEISNTGEDYSQYQGISFWIRPGRALNGSQFVIKLCSDTDGLIPVNEFVIPDLIKSTGWHPITIYGNLGTVKSVALYTGTTATTTNTTIRLDNIIAVKQNGLCLNSLISKNNSTECFYPIQSIMGTTVLIDNISDTHITQGKGYCGTTETVETYIVNPILVPSQDLANCNKSGTEGNPIIISGGWDDGGETFIDLLCSSNDSNNNGIYINGDYWKIENLTIIRAMNGINCYSSSSQGISNEFLNLRAIGCFWGLITNRSTYGKHRDVILGNIQANNCSVGITIQSTLNVQSGDLTALSNTSTGCSLSAEMGSVSKITAKNSATGIYLNNSISIQNILTEYNSTGIQLSNYYGKVKIAESNHNTDGLHIQSQSNAVINLLSTQGNSHSLYSNSASAHGLTILNCDFQEASQFNIVQPTGGNYLFGNIGASDNYKQIGLFNVDTYPTDRPNGEGRMIKISKLNSLLGQSNAILYPLAKVLCEQNKSVTISAYMRKSKSVEVDGGLLIEAGELKGINEDILDVLQDNINWQQVSITFTPPMTGVVQVYAILWSNSDVGDLYIGEIGI